MIRTLLTSFTVVAVAGWMSAAQAQSSMQKSTAGTSSGTSASTSSGMQQMSQTECKQLWTKAAGRSKSLSKTRAMKYTNDFNAVDKNSNGKISRTEFLNGCKQGTVQRTASLNQNSPATTGSTSTGVTNKSGDSGPTSSGNSGSSSTSK